MLSLPDFNEKQIIFSSSIEERKFHFRNDNIIIKNNEGEIIHQSSCYRLLALFIVGSITITNGLIERAKKFGFPIILMTYGFRVYETLSCETKGNFILREKQYTYNKNTIAKKLVQNKISNQISLLKSIRTKNNTKETRRDSIELIQGYLTKLEEYHLDNKDFSKLLGWEGMSSKVYFRNYFDFLTWKGRKPRVKHDIPNLLLDIGYTFLFNVIESLLLIYGFDTYKGVYHQCFYQRKSLVCDLVEPFRGIIDAALRKAYCLHQIDEEDFTLVKTQYVLSYKKREKYCKIFITAILDRKEELFCFVQEYYRAFIKSKDIEQYPIFTIKQNKEDKNATN